MLGMQLNCHDNRCIQNLAILLWRVLQNMFVISLEARNKMPEQS